MYCIELSAIRAARESVHIIAFLIFFLFTYNIASFIAVDSAEKIEWKLVSRFLNMYSSCINAAPVFSSA